ncbi:GH36-type glycosyl hydrolase domain-containing protein [Haliscomenobacter sp.]|uniref:GH36-type glycosyl hydrolase domain-containing protein n=1 Tax=Haliscomenobacter sp. TaxID=2717303 RepID=UPI003593E25D
MKQIVKPMEDTPLIQAADDNNRLELLSPTSLPRASAFLWNKWMMIHMNCRGYAVAQFMQPEPAKYAHAPNLEAKTFMQPEQPYYAHHPGRFFYIKDEDTGQLFSVPFEPVRSTVESFTFSVGKNDIHWKIRKNNLLIEMCLSLTENDLVELWSIKVSNTSSDNRRLSIYPYFPVGYMSWMNQSGEYRADLCGIVCSSVTPYQKYTDYFNNKDFKDKTFLIADRIPDSWEVNQEIFEGEGGLHHPSAIQQQELAKGNAWYETPACCMQYRISVAAGMTEEYRFVFGPAKDEPEIAGIRQRYFGTHKNAHEDGFSLAKKEYADYVAKGRGCLKIKTPDAELDNFVNHWLPRQIFYHGETNRLCTDPQTRNYLQDNMGMSYINPNTTRQAFLIALSQQHLNGEMPDGILIEKNAALKYINQVPHTDHCVWLPICIKAYLDETNDFSILDEIVPFAKTTEAAAVAEHINRAMYWLIKDRDKRGLNFINQGDWCDPMNMVGYKGIGVSGWLSIAVIYALKVWAIINEQINQPELANEFLSAADEMTTAVNKYLWNGNWYARGITDDNVVFGTSQDKEGQIFLNPQGWALLSGITDGVKRRALIAAVEDHLESPYGVEKIGPPFAAMRDDIGRVTQKFPGSAENGSVYNHASAFYIHGLYSVGEKERAYRLLRKMIPGPNQDDLIQRGQLPVFIPNYYRGAYKQFPRTAGRSSQLFNTGTVHWFYRSLIDGLFGLRGDVNGLRIEPQLPSAWPEAMITRYFRGAEFHIEMIRASAHNAIRILVDGVCLDEPVITNIEAGKKYAVQVTLG